MNKRLWIVFGVIVAALLFFVICYANSWLMFADSGKKTDNISTDGFTWNQPITDADIPKEFTGDKGVVTDVIEGNADAKVTFIEWMNFQCSACYSLSPDLRDIYDEYSDRVTFVHRYLYLTGHPNGLASAVTAEAAARQGKYHEMFDALFIQQPEWGPASADKREDIFAKYAGQIGLDVDQWRDDYKNYEKNGIKARLDFQNKLGLNNGVNATPYMIVNGEKITGTKDGITAALKSALGE
jgi:protein-disulfide isomerase